MFTLQMYTWTTQRYPRQKLQFWLALSRRPSFWLYFVVLCNYSTVLEMGQFDAMQFDDTDKVKPQETHWWTNNSDGVIQNWAFFWSPQRGGHFVGRYTCARWIKSTAAIYCLRLWLSLKWSFIIVMTWQKSRSSTAFICQEKKEIMNPHVNMK